MNEKFVIGTKFYKVPESGIPVMIRLKKQEGKVLYFNMGGYITYLTQDEIISMLKVAEFRHDTPKTWYRTINFFGYEIEQKWTQLSESDEDKFVKFKIADTFVKMSIDELKDNYIRLMPDGFFTISNVTYPMKDSKEKGYDVLITIHKPGEKIPSIICRQDCADVFHVSNNTYAIPMGISIPKEACPKNLNYLDFMYSDECNNFKSVAIYIDDDIDTILRYTGSLNKYNDTMKKLYNKYQYTRFKECRQSVKELLTTTGFVEDLKSMFGIFNFPFGLDMNRSELNDSELMMINKLVKPNSAKQFIEANYCPFDKAINTDELGVNHLFINIGDPKKVDLFILAYKESE